MQSDNFWNLLCKYYQRQNPERFMTHHGRAFIIRFLAKCAGGSLVGGWGGLDAGWGVSNNTLLSSQRFLAARNCLFGQSPLRRLLPSLYATNHYTGVFSTLMRGTEVEVVSHFPKFFLIFVPGCILK